MRFGVALIVLAVVLAAPAQASAPTLSKLQQQIGILKSEMLALQAQDQTQNQAQSHMQDEIVCEHAITSDNLNLVWHSVVLLAQAQGFPAQPDFPRFDDQGACARLGVTR